MLVQEVEMGILDLNDGKKKVIKLREDEVCTQGYRIDLNGKIVRGVPHRKQEDCHRFCYTDTCDSL
ncbi:MAG: hypothetical protein JSW14_00885 [Candidatus Bathyarchaeum sp.]|nr:MAG: hypothetical protein JSW14_00885 [Candidatus Bathyarchaeum sp.]